MDSIKEEQEEKNSRNEKKGPTYRTRNVHDWGSPVKHEASQSWGSTVAKQDAPTWGSSSVSVVDHESADEWAEIRRRAHRRSRDNEIERGKSPPPKLQEENLFSEGDSRPSRRSTYQTEEMKNNWGWGEDDVFKKSETLSDMFDGLNRGVYKPMLKRKRIQEEEGWTRYVEYGSKSKEEFAAMDSREDSEKNSSVGEDENNESAVVPHSPTRGDCIMGMASVLQKLTEDDTLEDGEESELREFVQ